MLYHLQFTMPAFYSGSAFNHFAIGVEFFFVLSGFVLRLTYGALKPLNAGTFYVRRIARIYPLHLLTFFVWCVLFYSTWGNSGQEKFDSGVANLLLLQSFFAGFLYNLGFNAVSWSISDEAFFYLLFPILRRTGPAALFGAVIVLFLILNYSLHWYNVLGNTFPGYTYFFPPIRILEFCSGIVLAGNFKRGAHLPFATILEVMLAIVLVVQMHHSGRVNDNIIQLYYLPVFCGIVWVFAHEAGVLSRLLAGNRALVFLGEASFGLYMWHHIIERYVGQSLPAGTNHLLGIAIALTASIVMSIASFWLFEEPVRRRITGTAPRPVLESTASV